jgi:citrate synthase
MDGGIDSKSFSKLLPGVWFHDPSFGSTSGAASAITELDGEAGILRYRGYPIEQLAENSSYLEVAYLLIFGELPTPEQFEDWRYGSPTTRSSTRTCGSAMEGFHRRPPHGHPGLDDRRPVDLYPEAKDLSYDTLMKQVVRLIAKMPACAGAYRHSAGRSCTPTTASTSPPTSSR